MADAALPPAGPPGVGQPGVGEVTLEAGASGFGSAESQATALGIRVQTQFGDIWRRFLRNKLAVVGLVMVAIVFLTALLAPLLAPHEPKAQDLADTLGSPSGAHWLGTDELGRDVLSRILYGTRIAVVVGLATILLALVIGVILGSLSGYLGGAWDAVIMRIADVFFAFPLLIGAIVIVLVVGGLPPVILALGIFSWATVARLLRSSILSVRESEYVEAARSLGAGRFRIVTRHVLPNSLAPVLVFAMVSVATAIVAEASLSYLGVGLPPDVPDWGNMISSGQKFFGYKDFLWFFPSMAVVFTVLGFVFVGDGLRDALDPAAAVTVTGGAAEGPLLSVEDLRVHFHTDAGVVKAVDGVSWSVGRGETLGIVGESGSGKSVSALAVMGLVPVPPGRFESGRILFGGKDLLTASEKELRAIRGKEISMIFQDPLTSLNPVFKVGHQIAEVIQAHEKVGRVAARRRAVELLAEVGIPNPQQRATEYPHQFSGGMRQRAMIAMALALDPAVLLADEPTTALDVTVQAQIMDLLLRLQAERGTAVVLITHDLGLVAGHADRVVVMYAGRVAETAGVDDLYYRPRHAYTLGLLSSLARLDRRRTDRLQPIVGQPPSMIRVPPGCAFHPRCPFATDVCRSERPELTVPVGTEPGPGHLAACHHSAEVAEAPSVVGTP